MAHKKRILVKCGTSVLCKNGRLDQKIFNNIAKQVVRAEKFGVNMIIVSSGAIQAGKEEAERLYRNKIEVEKEDRPIFASNGSPYLFTKWGHAFKKHGRLISEELVTYANLNDSGEKKSILSNILKCYRLQPQSVPIINENDFVSDQEIKKMDQGISENDQLARMVAEFISADAVLFVTEIGGVYETDPNHNQDVRLYSEIDVQAANKIASMSSTTSINGTGGIKPKLREAVRCYQAGMRVSIADTQNDNIYKFALGNPVGTTIGESVSFY